MIGGSLLLRKDVLHFMHAHPFGDDGLKTLRIALLSIPLGILVVSSSDGPWSASG